MTRNITCSVIGSFKALMGFTVCGLLLSLAACSDSEAPTEVAHKAPVAAEGDALNTILAAQPDEARDRYKYRNPKETIEFFGIKPGMTVVEVLPGGGWYTKILAPYIGPKGTLIGADYDPSLFPLFGFFSEERLEAKKTWATDWPLQAAGWFDQPVAGLQAFQLGSMPAQLEGEVDAILFIRALQNLARFEDQGGFMTAAMEETVKALKPGGIVGVVQHMALEGMPDDWASGSAGYLKKSFVIATLEAAGLEFVAESAINENPKDRPTTDDVVWRLPPSLSGSKDNPEQAAANRAIGESNRMTLLFRKPAGGAG